MKLIELGFWRLRISAARALLNMQIVANRPGEGGGGGDRGRLFLFPALGARNGGCPHFPNRFVFIAPLQLRYHLLISRARPRARH